MEHLNWGYFQLGLIALVFGGLQVWWISSVFWRRDLARPQSGGEFRKSLERIWKKEQRFRHDTCMVQQRFGAIDSLNVAGGLYTPRINVMCRTVDSDSNYRHSSVISTSISPPVERSRLRAASGLTRCLQSAGLSLLDDLSVEA
jgi:hypothetical protein